MDFTFAEIDVLIKRGYLTEDKVNTFGISSAGTSRNYGSTNLYKTDDGEVVVHSSGACNVDPDDGSYTMKYSTTYYKTFEDFENYNHYKRDSR